jgi:hypothetical protein
MKKIALIGTVAFMLLNSPVLCRGNTWQRVDIYYVNWDVETRMLLAPENVRQQGAKFHFSSQRKIDGFVKLLEIKKLRPAGEPGFPFPQNARLVVDLIRDDGTPITYYAGRDVLCNRDCSLQRPINEAFRRQFRDLAK